jgi:hypothetical protein
MTRITGEIVIGRSRGRLTEMAIEYTGFQRPSRLA